MSSSTSTYFTRLEDIREAVYWWMLECNEDRPHTIRSAISDRSSTLKRPETLPWKCRLDGDAYDWTCRINFSYS
jgi:hypothetical protein